MSILYWVEPRDLEPWMLKRKHAKKQLYPIAVEKVCLCQSPMSGWAAC